jgi:hypothetical protein
MTALRLPLHLLSVFLPHLYLHTPEQSGEALAELVLGHVIPPKGRVYASHVTHDMRNECVERSYGAEGGFIPY